MPRDFARILYAGTLPDLGKAPAEDGGFKQWLERGAYTPSFPNENSMHLGRVGINAFTRAVAFDYDRFALSAHESRLVAMAEREQFGATGWPLLKQYYSAFFSAHSIMRSRGAGVVNIDGKIANTVTDIIRIHTNRNEQFQSGSYFYSVSKGQNDAADEVTVEFSPLRESGGVHEAFWRKFVNYLNEEAARAVALGLPDNHDLISYVDQLNNSIMDGGKVWISKIRNEINYQHKYDSWMPSTKRSVSNQNLPRSSNNYATNARVDISKTKNPIGSFFSTCCYLSELNRYVAERISSRSKTGGTFGQKWKRLIETSQIAA